MTAVRNQTTLGTIARADELVGLLHQHAPAAYLLKLPEPSVHALRRIQVGDVPAVDTEAVSA